MAARADRGRARARSASAAGGGPPDQARADRQAARISVARGLGTGDYLDGEDIRRLVELGGFTVQGLIRVDELIPRYGAGDCRVTAYALEPPGLLWEVIVTAD